MLVQKNKPETERTKKHIDLEFNVVYLGYVIKSLSSEPKGFVFVNKHPSTFFVDFSKGYASIIFNKSKKNLIENIKQIAEKNLIG